MQRTPPHELGACFWFLVAGLCLATPGCAPEPPDADEALAPSGAYQALTLFSAQRAYPASTLPAQGYAEAFAQQRQHTKQSADGGPPWQPMGPRRIAGRILSLAFNPQNPRTLYAGSASGGLWRSHSAGAGAEAWHYVPTGHPVLGVAAIAISPADSNVMYIGTGEVYNQPDTHGGIAVRVTRGSYGMGILKTTDGGRTWHQSLDWSRHQQRGVQMLRLNPQNPATVWAATSEGVYVSYDAGGSWARTLDVPMATDLVIHPADTTTVLAACGNLGSPGHGIYRSRDGGATWTHQVAGLPPTYRGKAMLSLSDADPDVVYASIGAGPSPVNGTWNWLARSRDRGETWEVVSTDNYASIQGWYAHYAAASPLDPDVVYVAGRTFYPFRSDDGGRSLAEVHEPDQPGWPDHHAYAFHPDDPSILYLANDGGVYRTTDGGRTYEDLNGGLQTVQFYNGVANSHQDSLFLLAGSQDRLTLMHTEADGWADIGPTDGAWNAIDPRDDRVAYRGQILSFLWRTDDRGASWTQLNPGRMTSAIAFVSPFVLAPSNPDVVYTAGEVLYKSTNRGADWVETNGGRPVDDNPIISMAVAPTDADVVYAGTAPVNSHAGLFRTLDGGGAWDDVTGSLPDRYPMDVAVHPRDPGTLYVVLSGFGTAHLFKSTDHGETWHEAGEGLPDVPTSAVAIDPLMPDTLFVGNDLGVYVSKDGGATWGPFSSGLPDVVIAMDLSISPTDRKLRVATHGNGMYQRQLPRSAAGLPTAREPYSAGSLGAPTLTSYPNPFTTSTTLEFVPPDAAPVRLTVYDAAGRRVTTLIDRTFPAGTHRIRYAPEGLAAGTYVCEMKAGPRTLAHTLIRTP